MSNSADEHVMFMERKKYSAAAEAPVHFAACLNELHQPMNSVGKTRIYNTKNNVVYA